MGRLGFLWAIGLLCVAPAIPGHGQTAWQCVAVVDGDTLVVENDAKERREVSLAGVDAPEVGQAVGEDARAWLESFVGSREVSFDPENAAVTRIVVDGRDVGEALVEAGFAWLTEDGTTRETYAVALFMARGSHRGLWTRESPVHPARWREAHSPTPAPTSGRTLADLGAAVKLATEDGRPVVIDQIPSILAKTQETRLFVARMVEIARASTGLAALKQQLAILCSGRGFALPESSTATSVWSARDGSWVNATVSDDSGPCVGLSEEVSEGEIAVQDALRTAANEARRGGVTESDIQAVAGALGFQVPPPG